MAWFPISNIVPQYWKQAADGTNEYSGAVLKAYQVGTLTNIPFATDNTGDTTANTIALNSNGNPEVSGNVVIPHLDQDYKLALYPDQSAADADSGAEWTVDNIDLVEDRSVVNTVKLLSDLQNEDPADYTAGDEIRMRGRTSVGDGGEGHFRWDSSDLSMEVGNDEVTASQGDGGIYIAPASDRTGASGAWVRQTVGTALWEWYGTDATALQTALDNRIIVECGATSYTLASDVTTTQAGTLIGQGKNRTTITGAGKIILKHEFRIAHIGFTSDTNSIKPDAADIDVLVEDCDFTGQSGSSILADDNTITLGHVRVQRCTSDGQSSGTGFVDLQCGYLSARFIDNDVRKIDNSDGSFGIRTGQSTSQPITLTIARGNTLEDIKSTGGTGSTYGLQFLDGRSIVEGNDIRDIDNDDDDDCEGIYIASGAAAEESIVRGNTLVNAGAREGQIAVKGSGGSIVSDNTIFQTAARNLAPGITIQSLGPHTVKNNIITNPYERGIWLASAGNPEKLIIEGNTITNTVGVASTFSNPAAAIYLSGTGGKKRVVNNIIDGVSNTTDAESVAGIFSTDNVASLEIIDNDIDVSPGGTTINAWSIRINSSPTRVVVKGNYIDGDGTGFSTGTTSGVDDLQLEYNRFTSNLSSSVTFSGGSLPSTFTARGNINYLSGSVTWDPSSLSDGDTDSINVTVSGASIGDHVIVKPPYNLSLVAAHGYVATSNTAKILLVNESGGAVDLGSGDWKVYIEKYE